MDELKIEKKALSDEEIEARLKKIGVKVDNTCPDCNIGELENVTDIVIDTVVGGERTVIPNLSGSRCTKCGTEYIDAKSWRIVEKYTVESSRPAVGFQRSISTIGRRLGLYFPGDIVRDMEMKKGMYIKLYPRTKNTLILEVIEGTTKS